MPTPVLIETEYLEVNSVPLATMAWWIPSLKSLRGGVRWRGSDLLVPGAPGQRARARRRDAKAFVFELVVMGGHDQYAAPQTPRQAGLDTNLDYLHANLGVGSLVTAVWHRWGGATKSASVIPMIGEDVNQLTDEWVSTTLTLVCPAGQFA